MIHKIITLLFCLFLTVLVKSQNRLWFDELNISEGLSQSSILCIIQDEQGFIWIGTQYGLNRYDGYQFEVHKNIIGDGTSISSNHILSLFEDSSGIIWVGTIDGLNAYDKASNKFTRYVHNPKDKFSISNNFISSIVEDKTGNIWVGTAGGGLNRFDKELKQFEHIVPMEKSSTSINTEYITDLLIDENQLLIATGSTRLRSTSLQGGVYQMDLGDRTFSNIDIALKNKSLLINSALDLFLDNEKNVWIGTQNNGIIKWNRNKRIFSQYLEQKNNINNSVVDIAQDRLNRIWVATDNLGLFSINPIDFVVQEYNSQSLNSSNLNDDDVVSLLVDSTGVLWVGTWTAGIQKIDFNSFYFQKYLQLADSYHATYQDVLDIGQDSLGNVWLATWEGGLLNLNLKTGKAHKVKILTTDLLGNARQVHIDKNDNIWVGSNEKGLIYYEPHSGTYESFRYDASDEYSLSNDKVISIIDDPKGNLWIATRGGGLNYFDRQKHKFYHYMHDANDEESISDDQVAALYYDKERKLLWVGTPIGLDVFNPATEKVIAHYTENGESSHILGMGINTIFKDSKSRMWVGTEKGINQILFPEDDNLKKLTFTQKLGFGQTQLGSIGDILEDKFGNLWISSFEFITRYNPETKKFKNYNFSSGVLIGGYYIGSSFHGIDDILFFGGLNGLTAFKPNENNVKTEKPQVVLTQLYISNKAIYADDSTHPILTKSINETKEIDLNHKQNVFSLEFSALHYSSPKDNKYAYKLEGFDKQWIETDSQLRRATYTNLDPGQYKFFIKASNNEGLWSDPIEKLTINIHAVFWKTKLAYFIYFFILFGIVFGFIWLRLKQMQAIKLRNEQLSLTSKLFENTSECVWLLDSELKFLTVNDGLCNTMGYSNKELFGKKIKIAKVHGQDKEFLQKIFDKVTKGGRWVGEMWAQRKNGETFPIDIVIDRISLKDGHNHIFDYQYVGVFSDITLRKKSEDDLTTMAYFDSLTHLANRIYFKKLVQKAIDTSHDNDSMNQFFILFLDLDNFKNINDSLGHSYGDELLVTITKRLKENFDENNAIARLGGDEFALMIPLDTSLSDADFIEHIKRIGTNLLELIRKKVLIKKHSLHVSASVGVSFFPRDGKRYESLLRNADTAMYDAKKQGGNTFSMYSVRMNKAARKRLMLEDELNKAIVSQEIKAYYQPKVLLETGEIYGLEILARWKHKKMGWISPEEFIPVAEESNLINRISDQLLTQACQFILPLIKSNKFKGRMSFNLSFSQFQQGDIVSRVDGILDNCQFPAEFLEMEITESMVMGNIEQAINIMQQFKSRNIHIAIDDFGTGYSSLSYLKKFPIDTLKIDVSFIKDLMNSSEDRKIVKSIIHLAHNLGLQVVAEGAEKIEQVLILKNMDCELIQGFYFSKALSADEFLMFLKNDNKLYDSQKPV